MSTPARDHDQWTDSLGAWLLGALPEDEAAGFKRHLDECAVCREDVAVPRRVEFPRHRSLEGDRAACPRRNLIDLKIEHVAGEDELAL